MLVIGLTGGIGSGKSTVAKLFARLGIDIVDADVIAKQIVAPGTPSYEAIIQRFGKNILDAQCHLNRRALKEIIFSDPSQRKWLENLLHPLIRKEIYFQVSASTSPYCIVVIPLLYESEPMPLINRILVIDTTEEQQIQRARSRDQLTIPEIQAIIKTQISRVTRLTRANDIINNKGTEEDLLPQIEKLHKFYLSLT